LPPSRSAGVQTLSRLANPRYWTLIHEFKALTASTPGEYAAYLQRRTTIIKNAQNLQYP
jgi:hypothetical protein